MYTSVASLLSVAAIANAAIIDIAVGASGLTFTPDSVTANVGDVLRFQMFNTHSVAEGDFSNACQPVASSPFFSGVIAGGATGNTTFSVIVNSTDPIWYYCTVGKHCPAGMVGVINPPADLTIDEYKSAAKNATSIGAPATVGGGIVSTSTACTSTATSATTLAACNHDNCLRAVIASAFPTRSGSVDCSTFFATPSAIPAYASACSGSVRYASACTCIGVTATPTPSC